jgi:hypothetical protein
VAAGTAAGGDPLLRLFLVLANLHGWRPGGMLGYASSLHRPAATRERAHGGMCIAAGIARCPDSSGARRCAEHLRQLTQAPAAGSLQRCDLLVAVGGGAVAGHAGC